MIGCFNNVFIRGFNQRFLITLMFVPRFVQVKAWSAVDMLYKVVTPLITSLQGGCRLFYVFQDDCFESGLTQRYNAFFFLVLCNCDLHFLSLKGLTDCLQTMLIIRSLSRGLNKC